MDEIEAMSQRVVEVESQLQALEQELSQRYCQQPGDADVIWQLAENYRKRGNLSQALGGYQALLKLQPGHQAALRLQAILNGSELPKLSQPGCVSSPFVLMDDFLSEQQLQAIWLLLEKKQHRFKQTEVLDKKGLAQNAGYRSSQQLPQRLLKPIREWFVPRVVECVKKQPSRLGVDGFEPSQVECQLTKSRGGDFYKIHTDKGDSEATATREVTFVYYFHGEPKGFEGGDMLLFETSVADNELGTGFTRIQPVSNRLILFPAACFHCVLPVSALVDDWRFARFTLNGWLHAG